MSRAWSAAFARLAFMAMMALALVPAAGRVVHAQRAQAAMQHDDEGHCGVRHAPAAPLHGHLAAGDDCAYCALLAGLDPVAFSAGGVPALPVSAMPVPGIAMGRAPQAATTGLGARGPPAIG